MPRLRALVTVVTGTAEGGHAPVAPGTAFEVATEAEAERLAEIGAAERMEEAAPAASRPPSPSGRARARPAPEPEAPAAEGAAEDAEA